jgi:hypothetical protein
MESLQLQHWTRIGTVNRDWSAEILLGANHLILIEPGRSPALHPLLISGLGP